MRLRKFREKQKHGHKGDAVTFVSYRLMESGRELTAVLGVTEDTPLETVTARDIAVTIADQHGIPVADVELCGRWGERLQREMN